jgi:hypothetical protein
MRDVIKQFGTYKALQIVGFCQVWRMIGKPPVDVLAADLRRTMEEQGISKSAAYRYVGYLREWNEQLGRGPDRLESLLDEVAGIFDQAQEESVNEEKPISSQVGKVVLG